MMPELVNKYLILKVMKQEYILTFWKNQMDLLNNLILPQ